MSVWKFISGKKSNPLEHIIGAKVGDIIRINGNPPVSIKGVSVYQTTVDGVKQTELRLKSDSEPPLDFRLRAYDGDQQVLLLSFHSEAEWSQSFNNKLSGEMFEIDCDDFGEPLASPWKYWKVSSTVSPSHACCVKAEPQSSQQLFCWVYHRDTVDPETSLNFREFLLIEMGDNRCYTILRGRNIDPVNVKVNP